MAWLGYFNMVVSALWFASIFAANPPPAPDDRTSWAKIKFEMMAALFLFLNGAIVAAGFWSIDSGTNPT